MTCEACNGSGLIGERMTNRVPCAECKSPPLLNVIDGTPGQFLKAWISAASSHRLAEFEGTGTAGAFIRQELAERAKALGWTDELEEICSGFCAQSGDPPCWRLHEMTSDCRDINPPCADCLEGAF